MTPVLGGLALAIGVLLLALHSRKLVSVVAAAWSGEALEGAAGQAKGDRTQLIAIAIARSVFWLAAALLLMGWGVIRLGFA